MIRALHRTKPSDLYHIVKGVKIAGAPEGLLGDVTCLWGNVTGLWGDLTGLRGDVTCLWGDLTDCVITDAERDAGVNVADLIKGPADAAEVQIAED